MSSDTIERAAIGRIEAIGHLYNARTDTFCAIKLFKKEIPASALKLDNPDNPFTNFKFIYSDTYSDKFEKLSINGELKLSILGGYLTLSGSGEYLDDKKKSARAVRSSLLYNITTKVERLNIFDEQLKDNDCFSLDALNFENATHVVVGVDWGANSMITLEYSNTENMDKKEIEGKIAAQLQNLSTYISGGVEGGGASATNENSQQLKYKIHVFGDIMPTDKKLELDIPGALKLMKRLPSLVFAANGGKGRPLKYTMVSLSTLDKYLKNKKIGDQMIKEINEQSVIRFVKKFDEICAAKQEIHDFYENLCSHNYCVPNQTIQNVGDKKNKLDAEEAKLRSKLKEILVEVRSGKAGFDKLETLIEETLNGEMSVNKIRDFINSYSYVVDKITFSNLLRNEGVRYIGADYSVSLESEKLENINGDTYVLFFESVKDTSEKHNVADNKQHFLRMAKLFKQEHKTNVENKDVGPNKETIKIFIAVDLEMRPEMRLSESESVKSGTRICHHRNGKYINSDVFLEYLTLNEKCLVKSEKIELSLNKPNKRVILEIRCPGSLTGLCSNAEHNWCCYKCEELIEFGFDEYFYCNCGKAVKDSFKYKCNHERHVNDFSEFTKQDLTQLLSKIRPMKEMNILILGETGVGKSTWINGLANYMTFESLSKAEISEPLSLIPTYFIMTDENKKRREIKIGTDKNEAQVTGQAGTQSPKAYVFNWNKTLVRLIDTPGIGDPRGIEKDKDNFDEILRYIANLKELHGICILLKPNNAKLTVMFQFCIKELLTYLHKSTSDNIVFCFTNARSTFYRPGDTLPPLESLLATYQEVKITLSDHTMYCMDNESFRFLCALHNGVKFGDNERKTYSESWDNSFFETERLLKHISGLKPHITKNTIYLNDARKVILNLTKPLADISKNILINIAIINDKKNEILSSEESKKELLDKLYVPQVFLEPVNLNYPRTVCTSEKCTETRSVPGTKATEKIYVTICHDNCGLKGVQKEQYPNHDLKQCSAMDGDYNCNKCGCSWAKHMHIYYEYSQQYKNVIDESVQNLINSKKSVIEKVTVAIAIMQSQIEELKKEQVIIKDISVKFGSFLRSNAIAVYNDALKEYLEMLIDQEKDKVNRGGDPKSLEGLESMLSCYLEEKDILDKSIEDGNNKELLEPNEINEMVKTLYGLPINGPQLKNIMDTSLASQARMRATYTETHFSSLKYSNYLNGKMKTRETKAENQSYNSNYGNNLQGQDSAKRSKNDKSKKSSWNPLKWFSK